MLSRRDFLKAAGASVTSIALFGLAACGTDNTPAPSDEPNTTDQPAENTTPVPVPAVTKYRIGETVSTDKLEFTLVDAQFAIALNQESIGYGMPSAKNDHLLEPKEYDPEEDAKNPYVASLGHSLLYLQIRCNRLDRNNFELYEAAIHYQHANVDDFIKVSYRGTLYDADDFGTVRWHLVSDNETRSLDAHENCFVYEGEREIRGYIDVPFEANANDPVEIDFPLPNSSGGNERFIFAR